MTEAHQAVVTVRFIERWPDHEPRTQDPHYALFNAAKRRMKRQGLLKCAVDSDYHWGLIELHHDKVEFAHINDVDVTKFNALYGLHLDDDGFRGFVEQEGNLEPLCVTGESRVLMADGRKRRIDQVKPGDRVVCHRGCTHAVRAAMRREVDGEVYSVGRARLTAEHPVSVPGGFLPAGELAPGQVVQKLGMLAAYVLRVRAVKDKVLRAVVEPVAVAVMHALSRLKASAELLFHHVPMLEHLPLLLPIPGPHASVPSGGDLSGSDRGARARQGVQSVQAAGVGAVAFDGTELPSLNLELAAALGASDIDAFPPANDRAVLRAGGVGVREVRSDHERRPARHARFLHSLAAFAVWRPINHPRVSHYSGAVYNLDVTECHSYVVGGVAVHNCTLHHRGQEGVHSLPEPQWRVLRVARAPENVLMAVSNTEIGVQATPGLPPPRA